MSADSPGLGALSRVREFRQAARLVAESNAPLPTRCLTAMELSVAARTDEDPVVRVWGERAIWEELRGMLGMAHGPPPIPSDPVIAAGRRLRMNGRSSCPTCLLPVITEADERRWASIRREAIDEARVREGAVCK